MNKRLSHILTVCFLLIECVLYYFILTAGGDLLVASSYIAIVLCFLFALARGVKNTPLIVAGLGCTVGADFFLVVCSPRQLWGMVFFLGAQTFYAIKLHLNQKNRTLLLIRIALIAVIEIVAVFILQTKLDTLAVVSVCYYANLFMNIVTAFSQWQKNKLLPIGLVAFILCDTVIGLQVAAGGYLPIAEGSALHDFIFMDFNLSWFFYLPSQVMIALSSLRKEP